jgi:putative endonuclease
MLSRLRGQYAEMRAKAFLHQQGVHIIGHNVRFKGGEIDLIGRLDEWLIFFEIKYRSNTLFGEPLETLKPKQIERIRHSAALYLLQHPEYQSLACRFDVVGILPKRPIEWIQGAF